MMETMTSWIVGILMLALPSSWTAATPAACQQVSVEGAAPGTMSEECSAVFTNGSAELTVIVWQPVVARDGGPMVSVEDSKGRLLGKDVVVSRTSAFMGLEQEVLTTSLELMKPQAQILIYAKNMSPEDFQHALDGVSLAE
jgi:hypothetical protein